MYALGDIVERDVFEIVFLNKGYGIFDPFFVGTGFFFMYFLLFDVILVRKILDEQKPELIKSGFGQKLVTVFPVQVIIHNILDVGKNSFVHTKSGAAVLVAWLFSR